MNRLDLALRPGSVPLPRPYMARRMGQSDDFVQNQTLTLATDLAATILSGYLAYGLTAATQSKPNISPWAPLFWVFSAMGAVKFLHDVSRKAS